MLKTIAIILAVAAAPAAALAAASTNSFVALNGAGPHEINADIVRSGTYNDTNELFAQALNVTGSLVEATYSGFDYRLSAYASTLYQYDAQAAQRVTLDARGYVNSLGLGHGRAIAASWHLNGMGDLLWVDIQQIDTCNVGCDVTGYALFERSWTRIAQAGDSLFLTITAESFSDRPSGPVPSISALTANLASNSFRQAQSMMTRTVTISAVPEPASWALMIGGFGAVGSAARRRRQVSATAAC